MLQDKESEYRAAMTQLQEAERNKERISTEMGNIQQDIDTQKVSESVFWFKLRVIYSHCWCHTHLCIYLKVKPQTVYTGWF